MKTPVMDWQMLVLPPHSVVVCSVFDLLFCVAETMSSFFLQRL